MAAITALLVRPPVKGPLDTNRPASARCGAPLRKPVAFPDVLRPIPVQHPYFVRGLCHFEAPTSLLDKLLDYFVGAP